MPDQHVKQIHRWSGMSLTVPDSIMIANMVLLTPHVLFISYHLLSRNVRPTNFMYTNRLLLLLLLTYKSLQTLPPTVPIKPSMSLPIMEPTVFWLGSPLHPSTLAGEPLGTEPWVWQPLPSGTLSPVTMCQLCTLLNPPWRDTCSQWLLAASLLVLYCVFVFM